MEDAVLHGCIPVILQDGIHTPWESELNASAYAVRVRREHMAGLVQMLRSMPAARVAQLQAGLAAVWPRFTYLGNVRAEEERRSVRTTAAIDAAAKRDATATLLEVLQSRLSRRRSRWPAAAHSTAPRDVRSATDSFQDAAHGVFTEAVRGDERSHGCVRGAAGANVSAPDPGQPANPTFEGRTVNGWII